VTARVTLYASPDSVCTEGCTRRGSGRLDSGFARVRLIPETGSPEFGSHPDLDVRGGGVRAATDSLTRLP
jgi:hypothetical protein